MSAKYWHFKELLIESPISPTACLVKGLPSLQIEVHLRFIFLSYLNLNHEMFGL